MKNTGYAAGIMHCLTNQIKNDVPAVSISDNHCTKLSAATNATAYDWMLKKDKRFCEDQAGLIITILDKNDKAISNKQITEISFPGRKLPFVDMVLQCGSDTNIAILFLPEKKLKTVEYAKVTGVLEDPRDFVKMWTGYECTEVLKKTFSEVMEILARYEGQFWESVPDKETVLLLPLIEKMEKELMLHCSEDSKSASSFVEQILPRYSEYYQFGITEKGILSIHYDIQEKHEGMMLPTRMLSCRRKLRAGRLSNSTLQIVFDNGWNLELRFLMTQKIVSKRGLRYEVTLKSLPFGIIPKEYFRLIPLS